MTYAFPDELSARAPRAFSVGEGPGAARNLHSCTLAEGTLFFRADNTDDGLGLACYATAVDGAWQEMGHLKKT